MAKCCWQLFRLAFSACLLVALAACGGAGEPTVAAVSKQSEVAAKRALAVPSAFAATPANGWYWNPNEGGTGFMFETQGSRGFVAFFMYEEGTGKPVWYVAYGEVTPSVFGFAYFSGDLLTCQGGQSLRALRYSAPRCDSIGTVGIAFAGNGAGVQLPGGRTMIGTRFDFNGLGGTRSASQPETGLFWNPAEGGRGYAIEVQNDKVFVGLFHYNEDGSPTWNIVEGDITSGVATGSFQLVTGGQTLTSGYRSPAHVYHLGSFTLSFRNPCAGQAQLAGVAAVRLRRFVFGDLPAGQECRTLADGIPDVSGQASGPAQMQAGDAIFGLIDFDGDLDSYGIALQAGVSYQFDLQGADSNSGTLVDPVLEIFDSAGSKVAENDDADGPTATLDARIVFTPPASGIYYLRAREFASGTGSFVLSAGGTAEDLSAQPIPAPSSYAGLVIGSLDGRAAGSFSLIIDATGRVSGSLLRVQSPSVLSVDGSVSIGGALHLTAHGIGMVMTFDGFIGPQGDVSGVWSDSIDGAGGMFTGFGPASMAPLPAPALPSLPAPPPVPAGTAVLSWDASAGASGGYRVYFGTAPGRYDQSLGGGSFAATTGLTLTGFESGRTYYFSVTAIDSAGQESAFSNEVSKAFP